VTKRPFLIDTDTASDDAVAILMALREPSVEVMGITVVAGNVPVTQGARNALYTAELCGSPVPVYAGAETPLVRPYEHAQWFHGRDGLGDMNYPEPKRRPEHEHAVDAMIRIIEANPGIEIVTLGPLTNVALALLKRPSIATKVSRVVVMGGNPCCEGNVTPAAEYNIWVDPEAARVVFRAAWPVEMVGWHLCRGDAVVSPAEMGKLRELGDLGRFVVDCNRVATEAIRKQTGEIGISLPDPTAMAVAIEPTIVTTGSDHLVEIAADHELTRGMTVVDRLNVVGDDRNRGAWSDVRRKTRVVWTMNVPRFKQMLFKSVGG
jgi:purine nucleosidase